MRLYNCKPSVNPAIRGLLMAYGGDTPISPFGGTFSAPFLEKL